MTYDVILSSEAKQALDDHVHFIAVEKLEPVNATNWLKKALDAVDTLTVFPNRCPLAPENEFSQHTVRMLIVDTSSFLYRVDETTKTVRVTHFFHGGITRPE